MFNGKKSGRIYCSSDGLRVNKMRYGIHTSRHKYSITVYDSDNVVTTARSDGSFFKKVSIMGLVRKINKYKGLNINPHMDILNKEA